MDAHPVTAVSVATTATPGVFRVSATITDARTSRVLASPATLIKSGSSAAFQVGMNPGRSLRFTVTVDANGELARYRSETLKDGRVESGYSGTLYVEHGA
jgi:hypothetical protein